MPIPIPMPVTLAWNSKKKIFLILHKKKGIGKDKYFDANNNAPTPGVPETSKHSEATLIGDGGCHNNGKKSYPLNRRKKALVIECEPDILSLLKTYLESLGVDTVATENCDKTIDCIFNWTNKLKPECEDSKLPISKEDYDIMIVNTRLSKKNGLEVAKEIRKRNPAQRIILTTTQPLEHLSKEQMMEANINPKDILTMPFRLSQLRNLVM
ncbi:MAG: response regulator [Thermoproteota archaeon]|nr:response regulator [Thermoproteota archaeon]